MDEGITKRLYQLNNIKQVLADIMPICIQWLGNSTVTTIPVLYDPVAEQQVPGAAGDNVLFVSIGAGMNINAVCYRC